MAFSLHRVAQLRSTRTYQGSRRGNGRQLTKLIYADIGKQSVQSVDQIWIAQFAPPTLTLSTDARGAFRKVDGHFSFLIWLTVRGSIGSSATDIAVVFSGAETLSQVPQLTEVVAAESAVVTARVHAARTTAESERSIY